MDNQEFERQLSKVLANIESAKKSNIKESTNFFDPIHPRLVAELEKQGYSVSKRVAYDHAGGEDGVYVYVVNDSYQCDVNHGQGFRIGDRLSNVARLLGSNRDIAGLPINGMDDFPTAVEASKASSAPIKDDRYKMDKEFVKKAMNAAIRERKYEMCKYFCEYPSRSLIKELKDKGFGVNVRGDKNGDTGCNDGYYMTVSWPRRVK